MAFQKVYASCRSEIRARKMSLVSGRCVAQHRRRVRVPATGRRGFEYHLEPRFFQLEDELNFLRPTPKPAKEFDTQLWMLQCLPLNSIRLATQVFLAVKIIERINLAKILPKLFFHEGNLFEHID